MYGFPGYHLVLSSRKIIIRILFILVFLPWTVDAQEKEFEPYEVHELTATDFAFENDFVPDNANAVYLFDLGHSNVEISATEAILEYTRSFRIKIRSATALHLADQVLELYVDKDNKEKIGQVKGGVYNLTEGEVRFEKLKNKDWLIKPYDENTNLVRVNFKNVKVGSIIEMQYTIYSPFLFRMPDWNFQHDDIPVLYSEYYIRFPERLGYKIVQYGHHPLLRSFHVTETEVGPVGITTERTKKEVYALTCENIPAMRREPLMDSPENYRLKVITELGYVDDPNKGRKYFYKDWESSVAQFLDRGDNDQYMHPKNTFGYLPTDRNYSDLADSVRTIHDRIRRSFTSSEEPNYPVPKRGPREVAASKKATPNEMNWLLLAALRANEIDAYLVLASTRSQQNIIKDLPIITQFSTCLVAVKMGGEYLLLDASSVESDTGMVPEIYYNGEGLVLSENGPEWIPIVGNSPSVQNCSIEFDKFDGNTLKGEMRLKLSGLYRSRTKKLLNQGGGSKLQNLLPMAPGAKLTFIEDESDPDANPMDLRFLIELNLQKTGDSYLLPAVVFDDMSNNVLKEKERRYPVNFPDEWMESYTCLVHLDKDKYEVGLPLNANFALPGQKGKFVFLTSHDLGSLVVRSTVKISEPTFSIDEYPTLRQFYDLISSSHSSFVEITEK